MNEERRKRLLLGLLGVLVLIFSWNRLPGLLSGDEPGGRGGRGSVAGNRGATLEEVVELRVADLELEPATYSPGRDPFRFGAREREPAVERPAPRVERRPPPIEPRVQAPPPQAVGPRPPPVDLVYLGNFGPDTSPIAVFTDDKEIYNARVGDVIKERFIVAQIGYESADIAFVGFPEAPAKRLAVGG